MYTNIFFCLSIFNYLSFLLRRSLATLHTLEHRDRVQEEYILHQFHGADLSLPVTISKMMKILRPLTLDPVKQCLYLCRRPGRL